MSKTKLRQLKNMQSALRYFLQSIDKSPIKKDILKIILYGSLQNKNIHPGSDIDLAVIAKNPKKIEDRVDDLSYEAVLKYGELIEPIIYSAEQYQNPKSPFLMQIVRQGKKIYG